MSKTSHSSQSVTIFHSFLRLHVQTDREAMQITNNLCKACLARWRVKRTSGERMKQTSADRLGCCNKKGREKMRCRWVRGWYLTSLRHGLMRVDGSDRSSLGAKTEGPSTEWRCWCWQSKMERKDLDSNGGGGHREGEKHIKMELKLYFYKYKKALSQLNK